MSISVNRSLTFNLFVFFSLVCISISGYANKRVFVYAEQGVLDLRHFDFHQPQAAVMRGEWEFYYNLLLTPQDFDTNESTFKPVYINAPGSWNNTVWNGKILDGNGYATYRLKVLLKGEPLKLALELSPQATAYRLFVNKELVYSCGEVGTTSRTSIPKFALDILPVPNCGEEIEIIVQVSNFHHFEGGLWQSIVLSEQKQVFAKRQYDLIISTFILGSIVIMAIYHFFVFLMRHQAKEFLYFAMFCAVVSVRMAITPMHYESFLFDMNWHISMWLEIFAIIAVLPMFIAYLYSLFPEIANKRVLYVIFGIFVLQTIFITVTQPSVYLRFVWTIKYIIIAEIVYSVLLIIIACLKKLESAVIILIGAIVLVFFAVSDLLVGTSYFILFDYSLQFGLFVFFFSQMYLLSKRFTASFRKNELLTKKLTYLNKNLEKQVLQRTNKITKQKDKIEKQAAVLIKTNQQLMQLGKFKQGLTNMIVHDLKNPLNLILNISESYSPEKQLHIIKKTGIQMLTLISNLLDIHKYEKTEMKLEKKPVNLLETIQLSIDRIRIQSVEKNIAIVPQISRNINVCADKDVLIRIMVNLLSNAIKYSPQNGTIDIKAQKQKDNNVQISVKDYGIGIPKENQEDVFRVFGQVKKTKDGYFGSFGIGLAFCKMAVEAHGSTIELESEKNKGATFRFSLHTTKENVAVEQRTEIKQSQLILHLSETEKEILSPYIDKMARTKIYKISTMRKIIYEIPDSSQKVIHWKEALIKATLSQNKGLFKKLLGDINIKSDFTTFFS